MSKQRELIRPTLLVNESRVRCNIRKMALRAKASGVRFRPHFKTHQSADVGSWFRQAGVTSMTVSSVAMAEYFAAAGWDDILIASPINVLEAVAIDRLAKRIALHLTVDALEAVEHLEVKLSHPVSIWIELNTGDNRTGIDPTDQPRIAAVAHRIQAADRLRLEGLITHDGQTYEARSVSSIADIHQQTTAQLRELIAYLETVLGQRLQTSIGDTPTCKLVDDLSGVDEMRPGNFVFGDLTQLRIGSCTEEEIAIALACPIISKNASRREVVLQGGSVRLSMASLPSEDGEPIYGCIVKLTEDGWSNSLSDCVVSRLSQELTIVKVSDELLASTQIGDVLGVLPVHSCLTVDAMKSMTTLDGTLLQCLHTLA